MQVLKRFTVENNIFAPTLNCLVFFEEVNENEDESVNKPQLEVIVQQMKYWSDYCQNCAL